MFNSLLGMVLLVSSLAKPIAIGNPSVVLASHSISLDNRYNNTFVNDVFRDNILLTLNYMAGTVKTKADISWENIDKPATFELRLEPGQRFAFHDQILPEYSKNVVSTTNAHFNYQDGFKSDGYLMGDGVCHLASIIYWVAKDAGLNTVSLVNHNFANIPEVPKEYGVSIYALPGAFENSARQNLYIENSLEKPVTIVFSYDRENLTISATSSESHNL